MKEFKKKIFGILSKCVSSILTEPMIESSRKRAGVNCDKLGPGDVNRLISEIQRSVKLFVSNPSDRKNCLNLLNQFLLSEKANRKAKVGKVTFEIKNESDIVRARSRGRVICQELGAREAVGIKVATVISELARNIFRYVGEGRVEIEVLDTEPVGIQVVASDNGPGIADVNEVLSGNYRSRTGMGMGLIAVRNIMDEFEVESSPENGTRVTVKKYMQ